MTSPPTSVPEPSTVVLLGIGLCAAVVRRWRHEWSALNAVIEVVGHEGAIVMTKSGCTPRAERDS